MTDFNNKIIPKAWGEEKLIYSTPEVEVWLLHIDKGEETSFHSHPNKKTALAVLGGCAKVNLLSSTFSLLPSEKINIKPSVFHQTESWSADGTIVLEMETPPDKSNLVRMRDKYGRVGKGYEKEYKVRTDFSENLPDEGCVEIGECQLHVTSVNNIEELKNWLAAWGFTSIFVLGGQLTCGDFPVIGVGDATDPKILLQLSYEFGFQPLKLLGIRRC